MKTEAEIIAKIVDELPANIRQAVDGGATMDVYHRDDGKHGVVIVVAHAGLADHLRELLRKTLADQCVLEEASFPL